MIEKMKMMEQTVPTHLAVKVNGEYEIFYKELDDCFGYEFKVWRRYRKWQDEEKQYLTRHISKGGLTVSISRYLFKI